MKIQPQTQNLLQPLADLLSRQRVAMFTRTEAANGLVSRPMTPVEMDESGALWFITTRDSLPETTPGEELRVNLAFMDRDDGDYISIAGVADRVDDSARKHALWSAAARPWFDGPDDPRLTLLKVTPRHVEIWDGPDNAASRVLALAGSVLAGRPLGMGHKAVVDVPGR
jgi:general stress protein 26